MLVILTGCVSLPAQKSVPELQSSPDTLFAPPPQLWSTQKMLNESPEACADQAVKIGVAAVSYLSGTPPFE